MRIILSIILISVGVFLWLWGAFQLARKRKILWKIHALGAADTIGTLLILTGALIQSRENWPHMLLAGGAVIFWGTTFSFTLARLGGEDEDQEGSND